MICEGGYKRFVDEEDVEVSSAQLSRYLSEESTRRKFLYAGFDCLFIES